jgi:hypothetical protein
MKLTLSQRFNLARAKYEVKHFRRNELEQLCIHLMQKRMIQCNVIKQSLLEQGIVMDMEMNGSDGPEFISERTFTDLLKLQFDEPDLIPCDIDDEGWEDYDTDFDIEEDHY